MPIALKERDRRKLDAMLDGVLTAHAKGEVSLLQARNVFDHILTATAKGNETAVRAWLEPEQLARWKEACKNAASRSWRA
jgi:hypothetical protein